MSESSALSVVLAGGGLKTFWGMGVLAAAEDLLPPVNHFAGTSAGAVMALVRVSERVDECYAFFLDITGKNARNFNPRGLLRGGPVFPHEGIVRKTLRHIYADGGFARIRSGPPVHILLSYVAPGQPPLRTGLAAYAAYETRFRAGRVHGPERLHPGLGMEIVRSVDAMDGEQLSDWVTAASSTPPVTRVIRKAGRRYLDGALVDNVPVRALPEHARRGRVLVLLSSPRRVARRPLRTPEGGSILYLAPADEPPLKMWDYTSPEAIVATYELGQREGELLRPRIQALLES